MIKFIHDRSGSNWQVVNRDGSADSKWSKKMYASLRLHYINGGELMLIPGGLTQTQASKLIAMIIEGTEVGSDK